MAGRTKEEVDAIGAQVDRAIVARFPGLRPPVCERTSRRATVCPQPGSRQRAWGRRQLQEIVELLEAVGG